MSLAQLEVGPLTDGTPLTVATCACGATFAARDSAGALMLHDAHAPACDWGAPTAPIGTPTHGTKPPGHRMTRQEVADALGVPPGKVR